MYNLNLNKKRYQIKDIKKIDFFYIANKIANKSIRTLASKGNALALDLLEYKHFDILEDIKSDIILKMFESKYKKIYYYIYINNRSNGYILPNRIETLTKNLYQTSQNTIYKNKQIITKSLYIEDIETNTLQKASIQNYLIYDITTQNTNYNLSNNKQTILDDLKLTKKQLQILELKYIGKFTNKETAQVLNVSIKTIETVITRIRKKFKDYKIKKAI